jgi:hypothetical protein
MHGGPTTRKVPLTNPGTRTAIGPIYGGPTNPYAVSRPVGTGTRPRLDSGRLGIVILDAPHPGADPPARAWTATGLEVKAAAPVHAGVDGEAVDLPASLEFVIRPAVLRVRISTHHPGVSPSGLLP